MCNGFLCTLFAICFAYWHNKFDYGPFLFLSGIWTAGALFGFGEACDERERKGK